MKKIIAILLCAMLMLSCLAVAAESGIMPLTDKCDGGCKTFHTVSTSLEYPNACYVVKILYQECNYCSYPRTVRQKSFLGHAGDKIDGRCSECGGTWN